MKQCPGCDYLVPHAWVECRRCGTPFDDVPAPAKYEPVSAGVGGRSASAPPPAYPPRVPPPGSGPAPQTAPAAQAPPPPHARQAPSARPAPPAARPAPPLPPPDGGDGSGVFTLTPSGWVSGPPSHEALPVQSRDDFARVNGFDAKPGGGTVLGMSMSTLLTRAAVVVGVLVLAWFFLLRGDGGESSESPRFEVLPAMGTDGLPTLTDALRAEGEVNMQRATVIVSALRAERGSYETIDPSLLTRFDGSLRWVGAQTDPSDASTVSILVKGPNDVVLSLRTGDDMCTLMRDTGKGPKQVTIRTDSPCSAEAAPLRAFRANPAAGSGQGSGSGAGSGSGSGLVGAITDDLAPAQNAEQQVPGVP